MIWRPGALAAILAALAMAAALVSAIAEPRFAPAGWGVVYDFLVQDACIDPSGKILIGVTPVDGPARCPQHRNLRPGEPIPYHKDDWPRTEDTARLPFGYHRNDTYPIETRNFGLAVIQARSFVGPNAKPLPGRAGGGIWLFSNRTVASGLTQDPSGLQLFYGPDCASPDPRQRLFDAWVVVDRSYSPEHPGSMVARLTRYPERCAEEAYAYTYWRTVPVIFRVRAADGIVSRDFETLITDHFGGHDRQTAANMERFYLTRELGFTRWERWQNFDRQKRPLDVMRTARMATSGQCDPVQPMPAATGNWHMVACRQYTNLVPPANPAGDLPSFWIETIKSNPGLQRLFGID
jgi:hypothetical protein